MKDISNDNWTVDFDHEEVELGYARSVSINATLKLKDVHSFEPDGNHTLITTDISIRSENTGEEKILELIGIKVHQS